MWYANYLPTVVLVLHVLIVLAVYIRVIMKRPAPGVALAWLMIVSVLPGLGITLYLFFGERRIGRTRAQRIESLRPAYEAWFEDVITDEITDVDWTRHPANAESMHRLGKATVGMPTMRGNSLRLHADTQEILHAIIADVEAAKRTVHMAFYIWHPGGTADLVVDAVVRAAERGVRCNILVDGLGSKTWWRSPQRKRLQKAGVTVLEAMPVALWRSLFARGDLRLHRKIVVIDAEVAYTGSMNMVDPRFFKQGSGVGEWIDAMARVEGPAVEGLLGTLLSDWKLETGEEVEALIKSSGLKRLPLVGSEDVQVFPSGPHQSRTEDAILQMLLKLIYAAEREIIITTPYFVPDESMLRALRSAAAEGVRVELILPAKVDSLLVRYSSRSYFIDLMQAGVRIQQFSGGLLHTKSITVDGCLSMFGTVNLDMRSLWLNYEVSLFVYGEVFGKALRELQQSYLEECELVDLDIWMQRPGGVRFLENTARLVSPLL